MVETGYGINDNLYKTDREMRKMTSVHDNEIISYEVSLKNRTIK